MNFKKPWNILLEAAALIFEWKYANILLLVSFTTDQFCITQGDCIITFWHYAKSE